MNSIIWVWLIFFLAGYIAHKEVFKVISKTYENCKLFDKCIFDNISQLGYLLLYSIVCRSPVDY